MACSTGSCGTGGCGSGDTSAGGCSSGGCGTGGCPALHVYDWLSDMGAAGVPVSYDMVEVTFKGGRKGFYQNASSLDIQTGDYVIVEADRGVDLGTVHMSGELVRLRLKSKGLEEQASFSNAIRIAGLTDIERWEANKEQETETFLLARKAIERMNLPMKLVDVEWQFDHKKVTFYFTAEHRVDFRALVRDLAKHLRTRVELRQIGARDEAARIGGIGSCGRELCCSTWLQDFEPVSTQAAKVQNLPLNPVRLSGQCGRLKCCLNYELEQYMSSLKTFPPIDTPITTDTGQGRIQKHDIFKQLVWIQYTDGSWEERPLKEVLVLLGVNKNGGGSPEAERKKSTGRRRPKRGDRRQGGT